MSEQVSTGGQIKLQRTLSMRSLILFGIAMMFPVAPVAVFGEVSFYSMGHMALCYIVAVIPMSFTAYSYGQMAAAYPVAGSAYSYASKSINPFVGFMAGWAIFLDYALFPILNYIVIGIYMEVLFNVPFWASVIGSIAIVTIVNASGIKNLSRVNNFLVICMFLVVGYFIIACFTSLGKGVGLGSFTTLPFYNPDTFNMSAILLGTSIACFSFMGFDAMTTLSEEVMEPQKVLPKATVVVCFVMGAIFILQAYFAQSVFPDFTAFTSNDEAFLDAAGAAGGQTLIIFVSLAMVAGAIANAIDSSAGVARVMYGMGRDGMLPPKFFAHLSPKTHVPINNILLLAIVGVIGATQDLGTIVIMINFGALTAFMCVNASVIAHYYIRQQDRKSVSVLRYIIMPAIGFVTCLVLFLSLAITAKIAGFSWLLIGLIVLAITTKGFRQQPKHMDM